MHLLNKPFAFSVTDKSRNVTCIALVAPFAVKCGGAMNKRLTVVQRWLACTSMALMAATSMPADASDANWLPSNLALRTLPDAMEQTVDGVVVTARGYVAEFGATTSQIIGPFPTSFSDTHQIFGNLTGNLDPALSDGLGLFVVATPENNVSGFDYGGANVEPYIDSGICPVISEPCRYLSDNPDIPGPPNPKMDFVMVTFSQPVNVSSFSTRSANDWWAAGWASQPNLGAGLEGALASANSIQTKDLNSGAAILHVLPTFQSVVAMLIAVPPPVDGFGVRKLASPGYFTLQDVTFTPAVPEPSEAILLLSGGFVIGLAHMRRRAKSNN